MALGAKLEFVPAHRPEAVQMDISRYKVIRQKKRPGPYNPQITSARPRGGANGSVIDNNPGAESGSSEPEADSEADDSDFSTFSDTDSDSSDSMEDSEKSDTAESDALSDAEQVSEQPRKRKADPLETTKNGKQSTDHAASDNVGDEHAKTEPSKTSHHFYDINENANDRGTRSPKRIHKSWHASAQAPVGLVNRGVTCYMNAALQAILHLPAIGRYLLEVLNGSHDRIGKSTVTYDFALLFKKLMEKKSAVFPSRLLRRLEDINPMLDEWQQEDSHEYYMSLISRLQEDSVPRGEKLRSSILHDIFGGSAEQKVTCQRCLTVSTTDQDFYDLPVSFSETESEKGYTLEQSIRDFFTPETITASEKGTGYQCEKCKRRTKAVKQIAIAEAPEYLTVHIKRFKMDGGMSKKVKDTMAYPLEVDLTQYETEPKKPLHYKLIAVIVHEGRTVSSGHYIALARQPSNDWVMYDDDVMRKIPESYVKSHPSAYILLYSRLLEKPTKQVHGVARPSEAAGSEKQASRSKQTPASKPSKSKNGGEAGKLHSKSLKKAAKLRKIASSSPKSLRTPTSQAGSGTPSELRLSADTIDEIFGKSKRQKRS